MLHAGSYVTHFKYALSFGEAQAGVNCQSGHSTDLAAGTVRLEKSRRRQEYLRPRMWIGSGTVRGGAGSSRSPEFLQHLYKSPREYTLEIFERIDVRSDMLHIENQIGPGLGEQNAFLLQSVRHSGLVVDVCIAAGKIDNDQVGNGNPAFYFLNDGFARA
jgi:hypothetical protein